MAGQPSELEGAVLGIVAREGPCTAYAVRKRFQASPSPQWSGSAGAIYPLVERLVERGWLRSRAQNSDRRKGRLYSLTPSGRARLTAWLAPPLGPEVTGVPPDPLRTRLSFLGSLPAAARRAFVEEALAGNEAALKATRIDLREARKEADPWRRLVARGALAALRARKAWLREVRRALARPESRAPRAPKRPKG